MFVKMAGWLRIKDVQPITTLLVFRIFVPVVQA